LPAWDSKEQTKKNIGGSVMERLEDQGALSILAALANEHRLKIFRKLLDAGSHGVGAGALAEATGLSQSNLVFHMHELADAGLVQSSKQGRHVVHELRPQTVRMLLTFLTEDCCQGHPELCDLSSNHAA
tara:strand:+ start:777 stop:1163 length:387 start_codon:yes stop_codon:yes gene_type:complete